MKRSIDPLRVLAFVEGASLLVLVFVGVPLKHVLHVGGVTRVLGALHGIAFLLYVAAVVDGYGTKRLAGRYAALAIGAAFVPGGTFLVARRLPRERIEADD